LFNVDSQRGPEPVAALFFALKGKDHGNPELSAAKAKPLGRIASEPGISKIVVSAGLNLPPCSF